MNKKNKDKSSRNNLNVLATGTLRVHSRGFGFFQPDEREKWVEDIFIPKHLVKGAVDGDLVEIEVNVMNPTEKGLDGKVTKILKRGRSHLAGTVVRVAKNGAAYAYAPLLGTASSIKVNQTPERKFVEGDRLVIQVLEWGSEKKDSVGQMSSYLGHISDPSCDTSATIEEFGLPGKFSTLVLQEAKDWGESVTKKEIDEREDLREMTSFTIDPDTAKDFDDAISLSQDKKGHFHLGVHIADVSHYVKPGTLLDQEAKSRCNSTYLPGYVIPMLPHELSSHLCSLKPKVSRLTISILMTIDEEGTLLDYRISRSVIKSAQRFTYKEAKEVLDGSRKSKHKDALFLMTELCHRLKKKRFERGSIEFSIPSIDIFVKEDGQPQKVELVEYDITHQLVEEFMLKANEVVATHLAKEGKPLTFRVHEEPNAENMKEFALLAKALGLHLSLEPTSEELQQLFDEAKSSPFSSLLATAFIKSMKLATYAVQNIGHYGLGLDYYTHFTSPIRRYIDLMVHRVLFNEVSNEENLEKIATDCSDKERLSAKAEQSLILLKKLRLLQSYQEKEPRRKYEAVITHIKQFGVIFEVNDLLLEGFVPLSMIAGDYFVYNEKKRSLVGNHTGFTYKIGDKIEVRLLNLDLATHDCKWIVGDERKRKRN